MSKKTHRRQLERARAKRLAEQQSRRRTRVRGVAIALVLALVVGVVAAVFVGEDTDAPLAGATPSPGTTPTPTDPAGDPATAPPPDGFDPLPAAAARDTYEPCDTTPPPGVDAERPQWSDPPEMTIDPAATYTATIDTTCGSISVELFAADAPVTVNNFVFLASNDFYDGVPFHRTIWDFMIQGGDPTGTGSGGPGYTFEDELETVGIYGYARGNLAMANSGPATNGSQFFVIQGDASHLSTHTVFGRVTAGIDVVDRIAAMPAGPNGGVDETVWITDVTVTAA